MAGAWFPIAIMGLVLITTWLGIDGPLLGKEYWSDKSFAGAIIGGAIGGLVTVFAGWLAWSSSQRQIQQQQQLLVLAHEEKRSRTTRMLLITKDALADTISDCYALADQNHRHQKWLVENWSGGLGIYSGSVKGLEVVLDDDDYWRLPLQFQPALRSIHSRITFLNETARPSSLAGAEAFGESLTNFVTVIEDTATEVDKILARLA